MQSPQRSSHHHHTLIGPSLERKRLQLTQHFRSRSHGACSFPFAIEKCPLAVLRYQMSASHANEFMWKSDLRVRVTLINERMGFS
jgi:hypothetical protein